MTDLFIDTYLYSSLVISIAVLVKVAFFGKDSAWNMLNRSETQKTK